MDDNFFSFRKYARRVFTLIRKQAPSTSFTLSDLAHGHLAGLAPAALVQALISSNLDGDYGARTRRLVSLEVRPRPRAGQRLPRALRG